MKTVETALSVEAKLSRLVRKKADRFDPARFAYIEALVRRSAQQRPAVRHDLEKKALKAIDSYQSNFETACKQTPDQRSQAAGINTKKLEQRRGLGNPYTFNGDQRMAKGSKKDSGIRALAELTHQIAMSKRLAYRNMTNGSLSELLRQKEEDLIAELDASQAEKNIQPAVSLKGLGTLRYFEASRATHHAETVVALAVKNLPDNPGHLNRQMLATRCLCGMREIAPEYLHRWVRYMETLLWLEEAEG